MELVPIYSTPVWMSVFQDFDDSKETFLSCVKAFKEKNPQGEEKSNVNGYQSPFTLQMEEELSPNQVFDYRGDSNSSNFNNSGDLNGPLNLNESI
jgi:hypothetical protein